MNSDQNKFYQLIAYSFLAHAILVAVFFVKVNFFDQPALDLSQAIRVDMVGLPDKVKPNQLPEKVQTILKEQPKPVEVAEEKKEEPAKPEKAILPKKEIKPDTEAINLKKVKSTQQNALKKLKALSAIEKIKQDLQNENKKQPVATQSAPIKGRVISAGTALTGLDKLQSDSYLQVLDSHIKQYWMLPQWLINKPYKAQVLVKFDTSGKIYAKQIYKSSGIQAYDEYCLQAVANAEPFPKFTEKFSEKYKTDGVVIGFPE